MAIIQGGTVINGSQSKLRASELGAPALKSATGIHAAITLANGSTTVVTTGISNPGIPRNIEVVGNAATAVGNVVVVGTDANDEALTETIVANGTNVIAGTKAFKTVTSITVPARGAESDTLSIGTGALLGMGVMLSSTNKVILGVLGNAIVAPTITASGTVMASNTIDLSGGTYNGTKRAVVIYHL